METEWEDDCVPQTQRWSFLGLTDDGSFLVVRLACCIALRTLRIGIRYWSSDKDAHTNTDTHEGNLIMSMERRGEESIA